MAGNEQFLCDSLVVVVLQLELARGIGGEKFRFWCDSLAILAMRKATATERFSCVVVLSLCQPEFVRSGCPVQDFHCAVCLCACMRVFVYAILYPTRERERETATAAE